MGVVGGWLFSNILNIYIYIYYIYIIYILYIFPEHRILITINSLPRFFYWFFLDSKILISLKSLCLIFPLCSIDFLDWILYWFFFDFSIDFHFDFFIENIDFFFWKYWFFLLKILIFSFENIDFLVDGKWAGFQSCFHECTWISLVPLQLFVAQTRLFNCQVLQATPFGKGGLLPLPPKRCPC